MAVGQVQRSVEYSTLSGRYASFLEKDILPVVEADYKISHDPAMRVATGGSEAGSAPLQWVGSGRISLGRYVRM